MASAIIFLATNQKFNFSRYILLSLVKNVEAGAPFFMFPRFVQLIINHQLGDMAHHKEIFDTPLLTKKVFANIKMVGTGFSGEVTLLFDNMLVQAPKEVAEQNLPSPSNDPLLNGEDSLKLKKLMELCTNLSNKVLELETEVINIKSTYQERIKKLEGRVERLEEENRVLKELKSVHFIDDADEPVMAKEKSSKQERKIADIDADVLSMMDVNEEEPVDVKEVLEVVKAAKLMTEVVTTAGETKMDYFKGMTYDEIRPLFEKHYNFTQTFLDEVNEGVKISETKVRQEKDVEVESSNREETKVRQEKDVEVESSNREGESLEQEIAKKQKMEEETKELKKHLQIVTDDDDDDVYTDATPLALKIHVVDYKIHTERNRPYFKIIRADGNHMLFISLSTMLKNFDREDLESLWIIVKDRFKKTKPKNYSDDYFLNTLKIMFEKPNVEASVWNDQKGKYGLAKKGQVMNQRVITCFECGRQGYYRSDCPKLKDQNCGNKAGNKNGVGEERGKAYVLGGGDVNLNSNVIKGTFLLNNYYAFILFDSGVDQSFMSSTFSTLLDIIPNTLDVSYAVKLADERISKTNTMLRGYTLGLLSHPFNVGLMSVELGCFDVIIGMDWLANHHAVIVCDEKIM
uniref:Reverse transcriptase domain-containing protein n=1 Tax=Tanacetum cinerariifolium TaxID=118510 RepID=A0A699I384_TANCI|nr:reverse transcriptase domain-containing protein [Tanacetum cinerariifolium]